MDKGRLTRLLNFSTDLEISPRYRLPPVDIGIDIISAGKFVTIRDYEGISDTMDSLGFKKTFLGENFSSGVKSRAGVPSVILVSG